MLYNTFIRWCCQIKSKSNQIKSLLLSHHHSTSALVSEILTSVLQTVQKYNKQFTYGQTVQKKQFTYGQTVQKYNKQFTYGQTVQKKQFTYGQYIFTDCTKDNVQNTHTYTQYTQCTINTYLVINTYYTPYVHIYIMYTSIHSNM